MDKEFEGKKLLILGGITLACDIVKYAQDMGVYVIVADYNQDSPAKRVADEGVLIDATDVNAIVKFCKENNVDGVTTGFVDILMPVCYEVCKQLDLPYYATPKMLSMSLNKIDFKDTCLKYNIPVPKTYLANTVINDKLFEEITYPVFVKPLDSSGSRGAGICNTRKDVERQFKQAIQYSPTKTALIEDYITGREFLLDYIAVNGEFRLLSMYDRYMCSDRNSAKNYANISMAPSKAIDIYLDSMNERIISMFKDLGFTDGLIFLQGHINGNLITFYEMGCRLGGSFYKLQQHCLGLNPVKMIIRFALSGKMVNDIHMINTKIAKCEWFSFSYNCLLGGSDETISSIVGLDKVKKLTTYVALTQHRGIGTHYCTDSTIDKPMVSIYLASKDFQQAKNDIRYLNSTIDAYNSEGKSLLMKRFNPNDL